LWVWGALLLMTAVEVYLAYIHLEAVKMLTILLGLSVVKAGLIISYFMHLKYESTRMKVMLMASLIACLCLMSAFFPDALRILRLGVH
jgi:cytochrome c oxidase subunit 4